MRGLKLFVDKVLRSFGYEVKKPLVSHLPKMTYAEIVRFLYFKRMLKIVNEIDGDIVECGVFRGNSLLMLAFLVKEEMKGRKLWGFDSFEGFPVPLQQDIGVSGRPKKGKFHSTSIEWVTKLLIDSGLDQEFVRSQITLVKGFFNESLPKYRGGAIALLHLDVDLYESYMTSLTELYPKVAKGGVVLFDEYMETFEHLRYPGAQKAIDDYLGGNISKISRDSITGKYYLIK